MLNLASSESAIKTANCVQIVDQLWTCLILCVKCRNALCKSLISTSIIFKRFVRFNNKFFSFFFSNVAFAVPKSVSRFKFYNELLIVVVLNSQVPLFIVYNLVWTKLVECLLLCVSDASIERTSYFSPFNSINLFFFYRNLLYTTYTRLTSNWKFEGFKINMDKLLVRKRHMLL